MQPVDVMRSRSGAPAPSGRINAAGRFLFRYQPDPTRAGGYQVEGHFTENGASGHVSSALVVGVVTGEGAQRRETRATCRLRFGWSARRTGD